MKKSGFVVGLVLQFLAVCLCAQTLDKECSRKNKVKTLWVVDGVELNDSVFDYTLDQMRSDSAAVLASRVLSWVNPSDIEYISVADSVEASEYGFANCNGVVKVATAFREPLSIIINGLVYESKERVSAGEILGGYNWIRHIVKNEFADLEEYGIKDIRILEEIPVGCRPQRTPWVVVTTELPYYRTEKLIGGYAGNRDRQSYELALSADSAYLFSKRDIRKKAIVGEIRNYGTWSISQGDIILISSQDSAILLQGYTVSLDTVYLKINTTGALTLSPSTWNNKKSVTLKRQHNVSDR